MNKKTHDISLFAHDHPMTVMSPQVHALCKEFLDQKKLNYFSILRSYEDGGFFPITINPTFITEWFNHHPIITDYRQEHAPVQNYSIFAKEYLPKKAIDLMEKGHGLHDAMAIIYRYHNYYDLVSFSMPTSIDNPGSYYLSSLPLLDDFYREFLSRGQDIIKIFEHKKIILPKEKRDKNLEKLVLSNLKGGYILQGIDGPTYVSLKEVLILNLIQANRCYEDIASILNVSLLSIEEHVLNVKERTGMDSSNAIMRAVRRDGFKRTH